MRGLGDSLPPRPATGTVRSVAGTLAPFRAMRAKGEPGYCERCGALLVRKRYLNGSRRTYRERWNAFRTRWTCGRVCP